MSHGNKKKKHQYFNPQTQIQRVQQSERATLMQMSGSYSFSGPLPPPEVLIKYNEAIPNGAERIVAMAEQQSKHRQELERSVVQSNAHAQKTGPIYGFILALLTIAGGFYLVLQGKDTAGFTAILAPLAAVVGVFIYGKAEQRKERSDKEKPFQNHGK